jgi:hypothetical protein
MANKQTSPAHCKACGSAIDPWGFGMRLEQALDHQFADVRDRAKMKSEFDRYRSLLPEEKIRLPGNNLYDLRWNHGTTA